MSRKIKIIFVSVMIVISLGFISLWSWDEAYKEYKYLEPEVARPVPVKWVQVRNQEISDWIYSEGQSRAVRKVRLAFEVEGRVAEIASSLGKEILREGMRVTGPSKGNKGQLIARLDDRDYAEELRKAQFSKIRAQRDVDVVIARMNQAKSQRKLAALKFERVKKLVKKGISTTQKFEDYKSELDLTTAAIVAVRAQLLSARAAVEDADNSIMQAARNFERTRIFAPWSGTIARLNIREGDYVATAALDISSDNRMTATFPVTLIDTSAFEVSVEVPMHRSENLLPGNRVFLQRQNGSPVNPENTDKSWLDAEVYTVAPILSPQSRTVRTVVRTSRNNPDLMDGELLKVKIERERKLALVIPVNAVLFRDNIAHVFIVDPKSKRAEERIIQTGIRADAFLEVTEGLNPEDLVVTEGRHRLVSGDYVQLIENSHFSTGVAQ